MSNIHPKPTDDLDKAKNDLKIWGYCLLLNAIPKKINESAKNRLIEQANAEKKLNLAFEDGSKTKKWINMSPLGIHYVIQSIVYEQDIHR